MRIYLLIFILISTQVWSQNKRLVLDRDIEPYVEELITEAEKRGVKNFRQQIIHNIKLIAFGEIQQKQVPIDQELVSFKQDIHENQDRITGVSDSKKRTIVINIDIANDTLLSKLTVWHEIGHLLKYNFPNLHTCEDCEDIMSAYFPADLNAYLSPEKMKYLLDEYFCYLNSYGLVGSCGI